MPKKEKPPEIGKFEVPGQPYSTVVQVGDHFYFSGVVAITKEKKPDGDAENQAIKVLQKMIDLLAACGLTPDDVYSATVYLAGDMSHYGFLNNRWEVMFGVSRIRPRRAVVAVAALPFGCEIEVVFDAVKQS